MSQRTRTFYESVCRPVLFRLDPETTHRASLRLCQATGRIAGFQTLANRLFDFSSEELETEVAGIRFPNPIGLAAGWDKNGIALRMIDHLGFGFVEVGSISAEPSAGNPKPRLFRLPADDAVVVNYGLPNDGVEKIALRLAAVAPRVPRGANLVTTNRRPSNAACSADQIFEDYATSVSLVQAHATYLTLNLSCPNAKDGKDFFAIPGNIHALMCRLASCSIKVPVFLKLPPIESSREHDRWLAEVDEFAFVRGFMFNLAPGKPDWLDLNTSIAKMPGAVAGAPVRKHHNRCIAQLYSRMNRERYSIIGGGGVFTAEDAWEKILHGASLVQIYTALVYRGPSVPRRINEGLLAKMRESGFGNLREAVGSQHA